MSEAQAPNAERIEKILSTSDFFQATSTRRMLVQRILASGRGLAVGGAVGLAVLSRGMKSVRAANDPVIDFGNAALGAERIGIAFYSNALGQESPFGVAGDLAKGTLLNSAHRTYFEAARNQENMHRSVLESLGLKFP